MRTTKDQRDLLDILAVATEAKDAAYTLFSMRLDTRRNVEAFITLRDSFIALQHACKALEVAVDQATETKASARYSVIDEIMIRSGRAVPVEDAEEPDAPSGPAVVLEFPKKNPSDQG